MPSMTIALVSLPEPGHIGPYLAPAQRLSAQGHRLEWLTLPPAPPRRLADAITGSGATLHEPISVPAPPEITEAIRQAASRTNRNEWFKLHQTIGLRTIPAQVDAFRAKLREIRPDAVIADPSIWAAGIACQLDQIPCVHAHITFGWLNDRWPILSRIDSEFRDAVISASRDVFWRVQLNYYISVLTPMSPWCNTIFAIPELGAPSVGNDPPPVHFIGACLRPDELYADIEFPAIESPYVIVSFGTQVSEQVEPIRKIAAAAADLPLTLVITAGALASNAEFVASLPGSPLVFDRIPQRRLLDTAAALVTHGGASSVTEALVAGVPMLVSPIDIDQPISAYIVQKTGAGIRINPATADPGRIRKALAAVTEPGNKYRQRAIQLGQKYLAIDGPGELARLTLDLARSGREKPVRFEESWSDIED